MSIRDDIVGVSNRSLKESVNDALYINEDVELVTEFVAMLYGDLTAVKANKKLNESFSKGSFLIERAPNLRDEEKSGGAMVQELINRHGRGGNGPLFPRGENKVIGASNLVSQGRVGAAENKLGELGALSGVNTPENIASKAVNTDWVSALGSNVTGGLQTAGKATSDFLTKNFPDIAANPAFQGIKSGGKGILNTMAANPSMVAAGIGLAALLLVAPKIFKGFRKMRAKGMLKKLNARRIASNLQSIPSVVLSDPKSFIEKYKSGELG